MTSVLYASDPETNRLSGHSFPLYNMSHYNRPYQHYPAYQQNDDTQHGNGSRLVHSPPYQSNPSAMRLPPMTQPQAASLQQYSLPMFAAPQQSYQYGVQHGYPPLTQPFTVSEYQQPVPANSTTYTYYDHHAPNYSALPSQSAPFPAYDGTLPTASTQQSPQHFLAPSEPASAERRVSRSTSLASNASSVRLSGDQSRSASPNAFEMSNWGHRTATGAWACAFPGCTSRSTFQRGCDLRKHYRRHTKSLFCRHAGCSQATEKGFSSKKDRARHEAKHNPQITCEWPGCDRLFSRVDNMKDHVRRIHKKDHGREVPSTAANAKPDSP